MKVCYFIQSHKNPQQVCRLIRTIKRSSSNAYVLVSHDFSSSFLDLSSLREFSGIDLIERRKPARRGDSSILEIFLSALNWLFERDRNFDWLICLSGQDYPAQPISQIETFLSQTHYDGFMRYWDVLTHQCWSQEIDRKRFFAQYVCLPEWTKGTIKKLSRIEPFTPFWFQWRFALIGMESNTVPFNDNFRCYRGFYWNTLSRKCLEFFTNYLCKNPELLEFYQKTLAPEESIIQTVLVNSQQFNLCNNDLRYTDFPPELKGHAKVLTREHYSKIIDSQSQFARKLDSEQDSEILELLDTQVLMSNCA